jgi:hypothetical protein
MKHYTDYTTEELDSLYTQISETAQDMIYGGVTKDEVVSVSKLLGIPIDKWDILDTLVIETILGIVSSASFTTEVNARLQIDEITAQKISDYLDDKIFSLLRDESIDNYSPDTSKNIEPGEQAIYDTSMARLSNDPYREELGVKNTSGATPITKEKLELVDELFAHKDTTAHGVGSSSTPITAPPPASDVIITKDTLLKMEGVLPKETPADTAVTSPSKVVTVESTPMVEQPNSPLRKNEVILNVSPGSTPGMLTLTFSKKPTAETLAVDTAIKNDYSKDPYRELL